MVKADRSLKAIYIADFDAILETMEKIDPELKKKFQRELKKAIKPVQEKAKSFVPSSPFEGWRETKPYYPSAWGWATDTEHRGRVYGKDSSSRWQWSQSEVRSGIKIGTAKVKVQREGTRFSVTALALINSSVPGIIYELAGFGTARSKGKTRRVSRNKDASEGFINKVQASEIGGRSGKQRLIYKASYELADQVNANLNRVLKQYLGEKFRG